MIGAILDHLWQSTFVALLIGILTILFRNNSASVRHAMWFAASLKFLLPFSLLALVGHTLFTHPAADRSIRVLARVESVTVPFAAGVSVPSPPVAPPWTMMAVAVWAFGFTAVVAFWLLQWARLAAIAKVARPAPLKAPVAVRITSELLEPGLFGIVRPVILLPETMAGQLARREIDAILAHELCHLRRRDNLLSLVHMLVEAVFWFHPLVWFIGARLVAEREQACDESVLDTGKKPLDYAETILKVCRLTLRSRLPCAAGMSGANLDRRITQIMVRRKVDDVDPNKILLLAGLGLFAVLTPLATGGLVPAPRVHALQLYSQTLDTVKQAVRREAPRDRFKVARHRPVHHYAALSSPPAATVAAPTIQADMPMVILPEPQLAADDGQTGTTDAPVCRPPQRLPDSRLMGPRVCLPKLTWDRYKAQNLILMPDGRTLAARFEQTPRCRVMGTSASNGAHWITICSP